LGDDSGQPLSEERPAVEEEWEGKENHHDCTKQRRETLEDERQPPVQPDDNRDSSEEEDRPKCQRVGSVTDVREGEIKDDCLIGETARITAATADRLTLSRAGVVMDSPSERV
jgi:hypothetical protein